MFNKILFPIDFSNPSLHALKRFIPYFIKMGVENIFLEYVYEGMVSDEDEANLILSSYSERFVEHVENLRELGADVETIVKVGIASEVIANTAIKLDVDLIVLPSKGENIMREMFLGSTASNLVRLSKKPILLLKYEWDKKNRKIVSLCECENIFKKPVITLDFSKCSGYILDLVKKFEEFIEESVLVHIIDYGKPEEIEELTGYSEAKLDEYAKKLDKPCKKKVYPGIASKNIMRISNEYNGTLIVIGKKGRSHIRDLILGSTAERLIRDSRKPILLSYCPIHEEISYIS